MKDMRKLFKSMSVEEQFVVIFFSTVFVISTIMALIMLPTL